MKAIVRVLAFVLVLLTFAIGAHALTSDEAQKIAKKVGFVGLVLVDRDAKIMNGGAGYGLGHLPAVIVYQPSWVPDEWAVFILLHEVAHHYFWSLGREWPAPYDEWEADIWAADRACELGYSLADIIRMREWIRDSGLYNNYSKTHGNADARIMYLKRNAGPQCGSSGRAEASPQS